MPGIERYAGSWRIVQPRRDPARGLADRRLREPRRLDRAPQLLRQRDPHRVRHPRVQRELEHVRPRRAVDGAHGRRRRDLVAVGPEVDHGAGGEQVRGRARQVAGLPRVGGEQDPALRRRAPEQPCGELGGGRAGRAVVRDDVGVHREPVQPELRAAARARTARRRPHSPFGVGCSGCPSSSACSVSMKRSGCALHSRSTSSAARLEDARDGVEALSHAAEQRLRRRARVERLRQQRGQRRHLERLAAPARGPRSGGGRSPSGSVSSARTSSPARTSSSPSNDARAAFTQVAVQQRRRGRVRGGDERRPGDHVKQPARY